MSTGLPPGALAAADQDLADVSTVLSVLVDRWRTFRPETDRTCRLAEFAGQISAHLGFPSTLMLLSTAVERLADDDDT